MGKSSRERSSVPAYKWLGAIVLIFVGIFIGTLASSLFKPGGPSTQKAQPTSSITPVYDMAVIDIAGHFECACGSCGDRELATCRCETAIKEKNFIKQMVDDGYEREAIIETVKTMFGHYKT